MEFHGIDMAGPLNTDNIRALDGTLAMSIADTTGKVDFQDDIEVTGMADIQGNARVFQNLEVQGPLASFLQSISVGINATITNDLTVGNDAEIGRDLDVLRNADITSNLTANAVQTVNMRMTGSGPAAGRLMTAVDALGNVTWGTGGTPGIASVPAGQSILFHTNSTVLGYVIETAYDDDVVYITKGTGAGGEAGGTPKVGSSWSHIHGVSSVGGWHNHKWHDSVSNQGRSWASDGITQITFNSVEAANGICTEAADDQFNTRDMWTQRTFVSLSGNTDAQTAWRPKGRNFTLQTRL